MAKQSVGVGVTNRIEYINIIDSLSSTGLGKTGIAYNTSGLSGHYVRSAGSATSISFVPQTANGAWASGGFAEVDSTLMPGIYRVDLPNAIFSSGSDKAIVMIRGAANTVPVTLEYQLVGSDPSLVLSNASIANSNWNFNLVAFGDAGSAAQYVTNTNYTVGNIESYVSSSLPFDIWSYSGTGGRAITGGAVSSVIEPVSITTSSMSGIANTAWTYTSRTITGGIANTVTTLTDRTKFSIIAGIVTTVSNPVDITTSSMSGVANTSWAYNLRTITGGTLTTNSDKTGYTLSQTFPANFSSLSITGGKVSVVQSDLDYVINNIPQANYTNIAAANWNYLLSGIAITGSIGYLIKTNLDTTISSRSTLTSNQVLQSVQNSTKSTTTVSQEIFSKLPL